MLWRLLDVQQLVRLSRIKIKVNIINEDLLKTRQAEEAATFSRKSETRKINVTQASYNILWKEEVAKGQSRFKRAGFIILSNQKKTMKESRKVKMKMKVKVKNLRKIHSTWKKRSLSRRLA